MVLVDSSVWMECARRDGRGDCKLGLEALVAADEAVICGPILMEVLGGARLEDRLSLAEGLALIPQREIDDGAWDFALHCAWRLRDHGHFLPWSDILIASLSLQWGCRVYAADRHFEVMREVIGARLYHPGVGGTYIRERNVC
jgi:predicted nucleic acid-binding protein